MVLCSELLYEAAGVEALVRTLLDMVALQPSLLVLFGYQVRRPPLEKHFFEQIRSAFDIHRIRRVNVLRTKSDQLLIADHSIEQAESLDQVAVYELAGCDRRQNH